MKNIGSILLPVCIASTLLSLPIASHAQNDVMGAVQFKTPDKAQKSAGVWIDGRYVGYVSELRGYDKLTLLPGPHDIVVRQAGYTDFNQKVNVQPGMKIRVRVAMQKDPRVEYAKNPAVLKLAVTPVEAGVFLDGAFAGYGQEFQGVGRAMLVNPGTHRIKFVLPGYQDYETQLDVAAKQKSEVKVKLAPVPVSAAQ
jgi:PEGA domain